RRPHAGHSNQGRPAPAIGSSHPTATRAPSIQISGVCRASSPPFSPHASTVAAPSTNAPHCSSNQKSRPPLASTRRSSGKWDGWLSSRRPKQPTMAVKPKHSGDVGQGRTASRARPRLLPTPQTHTCVTRSNSISTCSGERLLDGHGSTPCNLRVLLRLRRRSPAHYGTYACSFCHRAQYLSQNQNTVTRKRLAAAKLRLKRLGGLPDIREPMPSKPKWTRQPAYRRIRNEIEELEAKAKQVRFRKQIDIRTFAYHIA